MWISKQTVSIVVAVESPALLGLSVLMVAALPNVVEAPEFSAVRQAIVWT